MSAQPVQLKAVSEWEVDWSRPGNTGSRVWARNPWSRRASARRWHWTSTGYLRQWGAVDTPTYRVDSWEIDWSQRSGKLVWGRNPASKMPSARTWHWVDFKALKIAGLPWQPKRVRLGRWTNAQGYIVLSRRGMTAAQVEIADRHGLWRGNHRTSCMEHRLLMVEWYGSLLPEGFVVRHLDGNKSNNSRDNLVWGTSAENTADHNTARKLLMYWHNRAVIAEEQLRA